MTIKGGRTTNIEGTELHHVTDRVTEKFDNSLESTVANGVVLNITSNGSLQNIKGDVMVNVDGAYTKLVSSKILIKAPSIIFDSPSIEYTHKEEKSFWSDICTTELLSVTFKLLNF